MRGHGGLALRVLQSVAAGGTASRLGGGKFANGAMSAAFLLAVGDVAEYSAYNRAANGANGELLGSLEGEELSLEQRRATIDNAIDQYGQQGGQVTDIENRAEVYLVGNRRTTREFSSLDEANAWIAVSDSRGEPGRHIGGVNRGIFGGIKIYAAAAYPDFSP